MGTASEKKDAALVEKKEKILVENYNGRVVPYKLVTTYSVCKRKIRVT